MAEIDNESTPIDKAFDRRSGNRDPAAWVRDALRETKTEVHEVRIEVEEVRKELHGMSNTLTKFIGISLDALPGRSPEEHKEAHIKLAADHKKREEDEEEAAKLKKELRGTFIKWAVGAAAAFFGSIILLGMQAYFAQQVAKATAEAPKVQVAK